VSLGASRPLVAPAVEIVVLYRLHGGVGCAETIVGAQGGQALGMRNSADQEGQRAK
jgi:hypothetical protein